MSGVSYGDVQNLDNIDAVLKKVRNLKEEVVNKKKEEKDLVKLKIKVLKELNLKLDGLITFSKKLYGFDSVFKKKIFLCDQDRYLTGKVEQNAKLGDHSVLIHQVATKHKIASKVLDRKEIIPSGKFKIRVSKREFKFNFNGGTAASFSKIFENKKFNDYFDSFTVKKDSKHIVLVLESAKAGYANRFQLVDDPSGIFKFIDMFGKADPPSPVRLMSAKTLSSSAGIKAKDDYFILSPGADYSPDLGNGLTLNSKNIFVTTLNWAGEDEESIENGVSSKSENISLDRNMNISALDSIMAEDAGLIYKDKALFSFPSGGPEGDSSSDQKSDLAKNKEKYDDSFLKIYFVKNGKLITKIMKVGVDLSQKRTGNIDFSFSASDIDPGSISLTVDTIKFINNNSSITYRVGYPELKNIGAVSNTVAAKNELVKPLDSILDYKGVRIERGSDIIDDLIDGLSLTLKRPSVDEIDFSIDRDYETIQNGIINYIGQFNVIMELLNIVLANSKDQSEDFKDDIKKKFMLFKNEFIVKSLREKMIRVMGSSYPTSDSDTLSMLVQIGIKSVYETGNYGGIEQWKRELDEEKYNQSIENMPKLVSELFGYDTDDDGLQDSGCAFELGKIVRAYTMRAGVISGQIAAFKSKIKQIDKQIDKEEEKIDSFILKLQKDLIDVQRARKEMKQMEDYFKATQGN